MGSYSESYWEKSLHVPVLDVQKGRINRAQETSKRPDGCGALRRFAASFCLKRMRPQAACIFLYALANAAHSISLRTL